MISPSIPITKAVAAGNDFVFAESANGVSSALTTEAIVRICDRHFGIGADGLVVMQSVSPTQTKWHFFNSDGSVAAMCGNAARAAAAWLKAKGAKFPHQLQTGFGTVELNALNGESYSVAVRYERRTLQTRKISSGAILVDTGVPHAVVQTDQSVLDLKDKSLAVPFRWPPEAGAGGANVTFFRKLTAASIEAVTFERGVEDYTLSCGTGVLAAALVASNLMGENPDHSSGHQVGQWPTSGISVRNPGGQLNVLAADFPNSLVLVGPASIVFQTSYPITL